MAGLSAMANPKRDNRLAVYAQNGSGVWTASYNFGADLFGDCKSVTSLYAASRQCIPLILVIAALAMGRAFALA